MILVPNIIVSGAKQDDLKKTNELLRILHGVPVGSAGAICDDSPMASYIAAAPMVLEGCSVLLSGIINTIGIILLEATFDGIEQPTPIYRAYGGMVQIQGRSWTPEFPLWVPDYRDGAGLPKINDCTHVVFGELLDGTGMLIRQALPIINSPSGYSVTGGRVTEYFFPSPSQVQIIGGQVKYGAVINFTPPC